MTVAEQDPKVAGAIPGQGKAMTQEDLERLQAESKAKIERGLRESRQLVADDEPGLRRRIEDHATVARIEIDLYEEAGTLYAEFCQRELELEANRAEVKQGAVLRLMQLANPASGEARKPYSATAAESAAALDHEYRSHLQLQSEIVFEKNQAFTKAQSARLRADLAVAMLRAEGGIR